MEFTALDGGVAVLVLISGILAYARGFIRETLAILAWIAATVAAFYFAPQLEPLVKEIPIVGEFLTNSCELATIAAFAAVFAAGLLVLSIFTPLFASAVKRSAVSGLDQALGFLFGVARGVILVAIGLVVYDRIISTQSTPMIDDSQTARIFQRVQDQLNESIPVEAPQWVLARYAELMANCEGGASLTAPETAPEADSGTSTDQ